MEPFLSLKSHCVGSSAAHTFVKLVLFILFRSDLPLGGRREHFAPLPRSKFLDTFSNKFKHLDTLKSSFYLLNINAIKNKIFLHFDTFTIATS